MIVASLIRILALVAVAIAIAGCGGDAPVASSQPADTPDAGASMLADSGASVAEALAKGGSDPIAVRAFLVVGSDGVARLCDALRESQPPQCGDASMEVTDLPPELVAGLARAGAVRFSEGPVQLIGTVENDVFVNDPVALAAS